MMTPGICPYLLLISCSVLVGDLCASGEQDEACRAVLEVDCLDLCRLAGRERTCRMF
jgi:hypothetical protein